MRPIDADALKQTMKDLVVEGGHKYWRAGAQTTIDTIMPKVIDDEPTADVQEVVRCKDCKYRKSSEFCECREPDFYCADGARMGGE